MPGGGAGDPVETAAAGTAPAASLPDHRGRRFSGDLDRLFLGALVAGAVLRLYVALNPVLGRLNSDQAVDLLQARHVAEGEYLAYYWGQQYAGTVLSTPLGWLFAVVGPRLWLMPLALGLASTAVALLTRAIGRALGHPRAGSLAGALLAVGPPTWVFVGTVSASFYSTATALALGSLYAAVHRPDLRARDGAAAGLLAGLALWASPMSVLTLLPVAALGARPLLRSRRALLAAGAAAVVGLLPVIVATLGRGQLTQARFATASPVEQRVERAVTGTWVSVFTRFAPEQVPSWLLDRVVSAALLAALVLGAALAVRAVAVPGSRRLVELALLLPVLLWVPFMVVAHLPSDPASSRYALPLLPYLALVGGMAAPAAWRSRGRALAVAAVTSLAAFTAAGLWQAGGGPHLVRDPLHSPSYAALTAELLSRGRTAVRADYWVAYRLAAESGERVVADAPSMSRYRPYAVAADEAPQSTWVVFADQPSDVAMQQFFAGRGDVERVRVAQFAVYYADRRLGPGELPPVLPTVDVSDP